MELLYHYLWKHCMAGRRLTCCDGRPIEIVHPGILNTDSGPDFSGARLVIDGVNWTGNVEIHVKASDWFRHGHDADTAYSNVILHVVAVDDARIPRPGSYDNPPDEIPQTVIALPQDFCITYSRLKEELNAVRCSDMIEELPHLVIEDWLESLAIERLQFKARRILDYYKLTNSDLEQSTFIAFSRALGFGLNGLPFELLAKSVPLNFMYRHADNLMQIEAMLFGQAGLLNASQNLFDNYYQNLCREYIFLSTKYSLRPIRADLWKFARTRPWNFPHRRIALLATALHNGIRFASSILDTNGSLDALHQLFSLSLDGYWADHGDFNTASPNPEAHQSLSDASIRLLIINVAAPFFMAYGHITGDYDLAEQGADLLSSLPPEKNSIISNWESAGLKARNALRSQALIHLRKEYCDRGRCLDCRFGHCLLRRRIGSQPRLMAESPAL